MMPSYLPTKEAANQFHSMTIINMLIREREEAAKRAQQDAWLQKWYIAQHTPSTVK